MDGNLAYDILVGAVDSIGSRLVKPLTFLVQGLELVLRAMKRGR